MKKNSLPLDKVKVIVDTLKKNGINHVTLTTREPLCYPDIVDFLKYCRFNQIYVSITTNGTMFTDEVYDEIYKGNVDRVLISLEGLSEDTNDYIRGKGTYAKVIRALEEIEERNKNGTNVIRPIIQINLSSRNSEEMCDGLISFLDRFKYVEVVIGNLIGYGRAKNEDSLLLGFENYKKTVFQIAEKISTTKHNKSVGFKELMPYEITLLNLVLDMDMSFSIPQCSLFKNTGFGLMPDGRLCRCNILLDTDIIDNEDLLLDYDVDKATKQGVSLLDPKYKIEKRGFCSECKWKDICNVCMLYTKDNYIDEGLVSLCENASRAIERIKTKITNDDITFHFKKDVLLTYDNEEIRISDALGNVLVFEKTGELMEKLDQLLWPAKVLYSEMKMDEKLLDGLLYSNLLKIDEVNINEIYD